MDNRAMRPSDQVRKYVYQQYVAPARIAKMSTVTFMSGEIHEALGFSNRLACVCDALATKKFEDTYGVKRMSITGPQHSSTTTFTFFVS